MSDGGAGPFADNVLPFERGGVPPGEAEIVETIMMIAFGEPVGFEEIEFSSRPMTAIAQKLGEPELTLRGYRYPAARWVDQMPSGLRLWTVVVDTGMRRAFHSRPAPALKIGRDGRQ